MKFSKRNKFIHFFIISALLGCSTVSYKIAKQDDGRFEFSVSPERILLECEEIRSDEVLYGFMIHVLDEENTVLTFAQGNRLGKETCYGGIKKIEKILQKGKHIYIAGIGNITAPRLKGVYKYTFPKLGTFHSNGRGLHFMAIANEYGGCYDAYYGEEKPCPRTNFPIEDK